MKNKICYKLFYKIEIRSYNLFYINIYYDINTFIVKIKNIIIKKLKKTQFFYFINKSIISKVIKCSIIVIIKKFKLFNINFFLKLKIKNYYYYIILI